MNRDTDQQPERKNAIDNALTEFGLRAAIFLVQVQRSGVVSQRREKHVIHFCDGSSDGMFELLPDGKFLKIKSRHGRLLAL